MTNNDWGDIDFGKEDFGSVCPVCGEAVALPRGFADADILILGGEPSPEDIRAGKALMGQIGGILKTEFKFQHLNLVGDCQLMTMWLHEIAKPKSRKKDDQIACKRQNEECLKYGVNNIVLPAATPKKAILLLGAEVVKYFCGVSVMDTSGMRVESSYFPEKLVVPCVNPNIIFKSGVGELRFAIRNFVRYMKEDKIL